MSKFYVLALVIAAFLSNSAIAQPVLTAATNNPLLGDVFTTHELDTTGISIGASGAGVTWNLSSVTVSSSHSTVSVPCSATSPCSLFPGTTYVDSLPNLPGSYQYYVTSSASWGKKGFYGSYYGVYNSGGDYLRYPFTYGSMFTDISVVTTSRGEIYRTIDSVICDGYGTLILPWGADSNVLRVHHIIYSSDTDTAFHLSYVSRSESYLWYKAGFHSPLMVQSYDTGRYTFLHESCCNHFFYYTAGYPSGITEIKPNNSLLRLYPNPVNDKLHITFTILNTDGASLTIVNMLGQLVAEIDKEKIVAGNNDIIHNLDNLPVGVYFLKLKTPGESSTQRIVVNR